NEAEAAGQQRGQGHRRQRSAREVGAGRVAAPRPRPAGHAATGLMLGHGIRRRAGGGVRVRLAPRERAALRALPDQLRPVLRGDEAPERVVERLFPPAYDDPEAEREYRELVGDSLADERLAAVEAFERTLAAGDEGRLGWTVDLDPD